MLILFVSDSIIKIMNGYFNLKELYSHIKDFYIITHIRITVFDDSFEEILSYPEEKAKVCKYLRENPSFDQKCRKCDKEHMEMASKRKEPLLYLCHASLTEIIVPLFLGEKTIGYLFFSHILNYKTHKEAFIAIKKAVEVSFDEKKVEEMISSMPLFDDEYLQASLKLLVDIASYLMVNHMAYLKYEDLSKKIDQYIQENLEKDLSAMTLCKVFSIGKTNLYQLTNKLYGEGLAIHIKKMRIEKAKELMRENNTYKTSYIAQKVGFDDYSYFIVAFKDITGMTPKAFLKSLNTR